MPLSSELCFIPKWIINEPVSRSEATYRQRRFSVLFSFPLCLDCYHYCRFLDFNIRSLLWRYGIPSFNAVLCEICNNNFENIRIESLGKTEMQIFFFLYPVFAIKCALETLLYPLALAKSCSFCRVQLGSRSIRKSSFTNQSWDRACLYPGVESHYEEIACLIWRWQSRVIRPCTAGTLSFSHFYHQCLDQTWHMVGA